MAYAESQPGRFRAIRLFSLFGFEVKLDLTWLFLALLISWSLGAGWFPAQYPDLSSRAYAWMGVAGAVGVFFSIVFHEFAHSLVARQFGMPIRGITLFIFGGVAEMEQEPPAPRAEFLMALAGPVASFVLGYVFWQIGVLGTAGQWPVPVIGVADALAAINFVVAVFNLVPAFPLDGGRMLRAVLWQRKKDLRSATYVSSRIGSGFGLVLIVLGVVAALSGNFVGGMWWILIGVFLRGVAAASYRQTVLHEVLHDKPVSYFMRRNPVTVSPSLSVQEWVDDYVYRHHYKMFPVVDDSKLLGCISTDSIKDLPRSDWAHTRIGDLMEPRSAENSVAADVDTRELIASMTRSDRPSRYLVVDRDKLVGVIALKDLLELISLKLELEQEPD